MSRRRLDSRGGLAAGLLGEPQTPISTEPLESVYEITGELGRCVVKKIVLSELNVVFQVQLLSFVVGFFFFGLELV